MRVTVTGGAGFIGVHLVRNLSAQGHEVQVVDNHSVGDLGRLASVRVARMDAIDIRDRDAIRRALDGFKPHAIVHLAAVHYIPYCEAHPLETLDVNVRGTAIVVTEALRRNVERFVLASSLAVYAPDNDPHSEEEMPGPVDIYGYSKWHSELVAGPLKAGLDLPIAVVRIANAYGPMETTPHFIPRILEQLRTGHEIELGNLTTRRDYLYVGDAAQALGLLATSDRPSFGVFNLSTGEAHSGQDVLDCIQRLLGRPMVVRSIASLMRPVDRAVLCANVSRLKVATGWIPEHSLDEGLEALLVAEGFLDG